jgi:hypothetical protein
MDCPGTSADELGSQKDEMHGYERTSSWRRKSGLDKIPNIRTVRIHFELRWTIEEEEELPLF